MVLLYGLVVLVLGAAAVAEPNLMFVLVAGIPLWLGLTPILLPPTERKIAKVAANITNQRDRRRDLQKRLKDPSDATGGLSLAEHESAGRLSLVDNRRTRRKSRRTSRES